MGADGCGVLCSSDIVFWMLHASVSGAQEDCPGCWKFQWVMRWNVLTVGGFSEWWGETSWLFAVSVSDEVKCPGCWRFQWVMRWNVLAVGCFSEWCCEMSWLLDVSVSDDMKCPGCWMFQWVMRCQWVMKWNAIAAVISFSNDLS